MRLARHFLPDFAVDGREEGVAGKGLVDLRDQKLLRLRQRIAINLRAADDKGFLVADQCRRLIERRHAFHALMRPGRVARDDDVTPIGQRASD